MRSLRAQLTLRLLVGGALLLGAAGTGLYWQVRRALTAEFDAALRSAAQALASLTEQKHGEARVELADENMPQFARANGPDIFLLRTVAGREIWRAHSLGRAELPMRAGSAEAPDFFEVVLPDGRAMRCAGIRFAPHEEDDDEQPRSGRPAFEAVLVMGRERGPLDHTLAALGTGLWLVGAGALGVLIALVRWGVRGALAPLARLGESVAAVDAGSLETRFSIGSLPSELCPIATRLNELLARLEAAFARERRFTATAAHELRTPLAELRILAEVNLSTPATEAERSEAWRDALATTLRMESLALRLLDLTRVEDSTRALHREPVALVTAWTEAWAPWSARAVERGITITAAISPAMVISTDPVVLGVILGNLCANAAEHAPSGASIRVTATPALDHITLGFYNPAGNVTAADVPHLCDRFWRKDPSRSDTRHHGLGLALAAEFAALLGGALSARLGAEGDLEFALELPVTAVRTDSK